MTGIVTIKSTFIVIALAAAAGAFVQYGAPDRVFDRSASATAKAAAQAPRSLIAINAAGSTIFGMPDVTTRPVDHLANT